jgi:hypothetical protein
MGEANLFSMRSKKGQDEMSFAISRAILLASSFQSFCMANVFHPLPAATAG